MDLNYINKDDWKEFSERYPAACNFLGKASLRGEYKKLKREMANFKVLGYPPERVGRYEWIKNRLADLETMDWLINEDNGPSKTGQGEPK